MTRLRVLSPALLGILTGVVLGSAKDAPPLVGESENVYTLAAENAQALGLAVDDVSPQAPRLFVLDASGKVFAYRLDNMPEQRLGELPFSRVYDLPAGADGSPPASPRGLAYTREDDRDVLWFLDWHAADDGVASQLWRFEVDGGEAASVDLSRYPLRIGDREVLDLAWDRGKVLVCFDASGYADHNRRVQRGIVELEWSGPGDGKLEFVRHLPDAGTSPSRGLACMELEGARYLWATIAGDHVYCADAPSGRALFHFNRPRSTAESDSLGGLSFGNDALWVAESAPGADRVHRVNVTRNLDAPRQGPRVLRHLTMTIETQPEDDAEDPGSVYHHYSRPYAYEQLRNQGIWVETEKVEDVSGVPNATVKGFTRDPAGDVASRQHMSTVEYAGAPARAYASRYEIDLWTNPYRKYVYPHRVDGNREALEGTDYLADDPDLYNLRDKKTYDAFIARVRTHVEKKYGVAADMENAYWAARNVVEYIQDHYYYPNRAKGKPAAVDYDRKHYDANPANLKIELSARAYDKSQIIACSGTSVMVAGAMRHLGIPARWLGTGTQQDPDTWDTNGNGLLDAGETAPSSNGHRYTQVWLGSHYGWVCFDATPTKPDANDYDPPPPIQPQWRYLHRAAAGHRRDNRVVFNVGSTLIRQLYRDFEYDETLAVDNNCGGDQRYNLQGRFEKPEAWKLPGHRIWLTNLCFLQDVTVSGPKAETRVAWKPEGAWEKDAGATVSVYLQQLAPGATEPREIAPLAEAIPWNTGTAIVDLSEFGGEHYRIVVRKDGDRETGGRSDPFDVP